MLALLKAGAKDADDVNVKFNPNQDSALHAAAAYGAEKACSVPLLLAEADPNALDAHYLADPVALGRSTWTPWR